jgi:hypothetical protein
VPKIDVTLPVVEVALVYCAVHGVPGGERRRG